MFVIAGGVRIGEASRRAMHSDCAQHPEILGAPWWGWPAGGCGQHLEGGVERVVPVLVDST